MRNWGRSLCSRWRVPGVTGLPARVVPEVTATMPRVLALLLLPVVSAFALGNAGPVFRVKYENEVTLADPAPGYKFFTLRTGTDQAELTPLDLKADKWVALPHRGEKTDYNVELYCVPGTEAQKHDTPAKLLDAIRAGKAAHSKVLFEAFELAFRQPEYPERRTRSVVTVNARGKVSVTTAPVEFAPPPRKTSRLMLPGVFAALALMAGGMWLWRKR